MRRLEGPGRRLVDWATECALPLWATSGFDGTHGRFEERLSFQGAPIRDVPIRLMTQARQVHAYAMAARHAWFPEAAALARQAYASMVRDFHRRDGRPGWIHSIRRDGVPSDTSRDLYGHAFALLAIASYVQLSSDHEALSLAVETLDFLEGDMAADEGGGFVERLPLHGGPRRQNPHMHLFEAMLALWECSQDPRYLGRVHRLFDLFAVRFFQGGAVGEYYTARLDPFAGAHGKIVEPGHHYEWVWLLRRFERLAGTGVERYVAALYDHAERYGLDRDGLVVDEIQADGALRSGSRRVWPMTEAIRANLVVGPRDGADPVRRASVLTEKLLERFLLPAPPGGWIDRLDDRGNRATDFMPASTLYHLMGALDAWASLIPARAEAPDHAPTRSDRGSATRCSDQGRSTPG